VALSRRTGNAGKNFQGLGNITGELYVKKPQMTMEIDRPAAAVYGVSVDQVRQELYDCFGAR
jgi:HAE1 family hydrophobic/amphiphilic exporter-1